MLSKIIKIHTHIVMHSYILVISELYEVNRNIN